MWIFYIFQHKMRKLFLKLCFYCFMCDLVDNLLKTDVPKLKTDVEVFFLSKISFSKSFNNF